MGFDSKCDFAPPTFLLGLLLCPWMWVGFWWDPTFSCQWLFSSELPFWSSHGVDEHRSFSSIISGWPVLPMWALCLEAWVPRHLCVPLGLLLRPHGGGGMWGGAGGKHSASCSHPWPCTGILTVANFLFNQRMKVSYSEYN